MNSEIITQNMLMKTLEYWYSRKSDAFHVPSHHYFHTWLSLAAFELQQKNLGIRLLSDFFSLTKKGHTEFNKHALILIMERHVKSLKGILADQVRKYIKNQHFSVNFSTRTGNNWLFLRMFLHLKCYLLFYNPTDLSSFRQYLKHLLGLYHKGLFCDFPPPGVSSSLPAFPLTYSFKILALIMECFWLLKIKELDNGLQDELKTIINESVPIHLAFIAPDGEALYYGRSDNALFGYANVLHVLSNVV